MNDLPVERDGDDRQRRHEDGRVLAGVGQPAEELRLRTERPAPVENLRRCVGG